ncbi:MAG: tryptophan 2,3-dioxygenase family protein [Flavobacteriales bacterium]
MDWKNDEKLHEVLGKLHEKYSSTGQDLVSYLEGLYHAKYLNYWDYIHQDVLLSLQNPRTNIEDEAIFIMYHQITELYFKLSLKELNHISEQEQISGDYFLNKLSRVNRYFQALTNSFDVMSHGMEREQFLTFRLTLQPASGFQSSQYRDIEFISTKLDYLIHKDKRHLAAEMTEEEKLQNVYWRAGGIQRNTGKPAYTNVEFEEKYWDHFQEYTQTYKNRTIWDQYKKLSGDEQNRADIKQALRQYDSYVNVNWPLAHYKSAVRYLVQEDTPVAATGGTNWMKYLPPRFQKRIFFPELWTKEELENWGKGWVKETIDAHFYDK